MTLFASGQGEARPASRVRVAVLVAAPVVVFLCMACATAFLVAWLTFMSAMGHGSLSAREARPFSIAGFAVAAAVAAGTALIGERLLLGPRAGRPTGQRALIRRTRAGSAVLAVALVVVAPSAARMWYVERQLTAAQSDDWQERSDAIAELAMLRTARGYRLLHDIATNRAADLDARAQATSALAEFPEAKDTLLGLADDPAPQVQAAAAASLLLFADDPRAWAIIERLAFDERALVREPVQSALRYGRMQQKAVEKRTRLLEKIASGDRPTEALAAAAEIGSSGFETAIAVLEDVSKDDQTRLQAIGVLGQIRDARATARLHQIVVGGVEAGFVAAPSEESYRAAAAEAIGRIQGYAPAEELLEAYSLERHAVFDTREILKAQKAYAEATGFFDGRLSCLELPATCGPGRDPDQSYLAPSLTRDTRHGYLHRLEPGPRVAPADLVARQASPTSVLGFAYVSVPQVSGQSGIRGFCADSTGAICFTRRGLRPAVRDGQCVMSAAPPMPATPAPYSYEPVNRECQVSR